MFLDDKASNTIFNFVSSKLVVLIKYIQIACDIFKYMLFYQWFLVRTDVRTKLCSRIWAKAI